MTKVCPVKMEHSLSHSRSQAAKPKGGLKAPPLQIVKYCGYEVSSCPGKWGHADARALQDEYIQCLHGGPLISKIILKFLLLRSCKVAKLLFACFVSFFWATWVPPHSMSMLWRVPPFMHKAPSSSVLGWPQYSSPLPNVSVYNFKHKSTSWNPNVESYGNTQQWIIRDM